MNAISMSFACKLAIGEAIASLVLSVSTFVVSMLEILFPLSGPIFSISFLWVFLVVFYLPIYSFFVIIYYFVIYIVFVNLSLRSFNEPIFHFISAFLFRFLVCFNMFFVSSPSPLIRDSSSYHFLVWCPKNLEFEGFCILYRPFLETI